MLHVYLLLGCTLIMFGTWLYQRRVNNAGWIDVVWAFTLGGLAVVHAVLADGNAWMRILTAIMGGLWGLRLGWHLAVRVAGEPEDGRYQAMRQAFGEREQLNLLWFYLAQALVAWLFGWVFWVTANSGESFSVFTVVAMILWAGSIAGETLADRQLAAFKQQSDSKGKVCNIGLWRYSRHPNYFFEWLHWCSYPLLAVGAGYWWVALAGPIVMLLFLYRITGIPYTEKQSLRSRGDAYRDYQQTVSEFFPWPPKDN